MAARRVIEAGNKVRVSWPFHRRHGEVALVVQKRENGKRLVRFGDGSCGVLDCHEYEAIS